MVQETSIVVLLLTLLASNVVGSDEPISEASLDRQYNSAWNGLVTAEMNYRYHLKRADVLNHSPSRFVLGSLKFLSIILFALPYFLDSIKDAAKKASKRSTESSDKDANTYTSKVGVLRAFGIKYRTHLFFAGGVFALVFPDFINTSGPDIQNIVYHQTKSAEWNALARDWQDVWEGIYWEGKGVPEELMASLRKRETEISNNEHDKRDSVLFSETKRQTEAFLLGSLVRKDQASRTGSDEL